jgi:hypothetical protein
VQLCAKKWGCAIRQSDEYLARAKKQIAEASKVNLEQQRGIFIARCNDIYHAHRKRAPHAALKAVELAADLQGMLTKGAQINLTATATSGAGLSPESIAEVQRVVAEATKTALDEQAKKGGSDAAQS